MNLFELSAKIHADTKDYEKAIKNATKASKSLKDVMERASTQSETNKNKIKVLASEYSSAKGKVAILTTAFNKAAKEEGVTAERTKQLAKELKEAEKESSDLRGELDELAKNSNKAGNKLSKLGSLLGSGLKTAGKIGLAAVGAAASGVAALTTAAVKNYAEYEQLVGGVETLFAKSADSIKKYADEAYKTAGLSANEYMSTVTSFSASLMQSLGKGEQTNLEELQETLDAEYEAAKRSYEDKYDLEKKLWDESIAYAKEHDTGREKELQERRDQELKALKRNQEDSLKLLKKGNDERLAEAERANNLSVTTAETQEEAADLANQAVIDMADNANKMGTSMELIQNAYQGFSKQNYTMLDNLKLGYGGTKEEMARLIEDAARLSDAVDAQDMSFANIVKAINVVQTELGITGTTAKEASTTISGSIASMKAAFTNLTVGIADENANVEKLFDEFFESVTTVAKNVLPKVFTAMERAAKALGDFVVDGIIMVAENAPELIKAGVNALKSLLKGITKNAKLIVNAAVDIVFTLIDGLIELTPDLFEAAGELLGAIVEAIPEIVVKLAKSVPKIIEAIVNGLGNGVEAVGNAIVNLFTGAADRAEQSRQRIESMLSFGDLMEKTATNMTDVTKMMSDDGKTLEEIGDIIEEKEGQITTIIKTSKEKNQKLREEEILDIKKHIEEIRKLEGQKLSIYQGRQAAYSSLFESFAEGGFTTEELAEGLGKTEQAMEDALAALDEYYVSQVQTIGLAFDLGSKEYKDELEKLNKWRKEEESKIKKQQRESVDLAIEIIGQTAVGNGFLFEDVVKVAQNTLNEADKYKNLLGQTSVTGQKILRDNLVQSVNEEFLQTAGALFSTIAEGVQSGFSFSQETKNLASTLIDSFFSEYSESEVALEAARKIAEGLEGEVSELENVYNMSAEEIGEVLKKRLIEKMKIHKPQNDPAYAEGFEKLNNVSITQNIYSPVNSAADLMSEALYQANKGALGFG